MDKLTLNNSNKQRKTNGRSIPICGKQPVNTSSKLKRDRRTGHTMLYQEVSFRNKKKEYHTIDNNIVFDKM